MDMSQQSSIMLDPESSAILESFVSNGCYPDEATAVQQAFRALKHVNKDYEEKLALLRQAIQDGVDSGIAEGDVFARIRERTGLPPRVPR